MQVGGVELLLMMPLEAADRNFPLHVLTDALQEWNTDFFFILMLSRKVVL